MRISRSVMAVCGVVLAAVVIGFTNPKAVHAVVTAALVQVTNTASNPVVSSEVSLAPAQLVQLYCNGTAKCFQIAAGGGVGTSAYVVPAGKTLVITDIDINTSSTGGVGFIALAPDYGVCECLSTTPLVYSFAEDGVTHHFSLTHGLAWPSGGTLGFSSNASENVSLYGYLADN